MPKKAIIGDTYFDATNGYVIECVAGHPLFPTRKWVAQHRRVLAEKLGRVLTRDEIVHHKDHNKRNNKVSNLTLTTRSEHPSHHEGRKNTEETKLLMRKSAKARCTSEWRQSVSERVAAQHKQGKFGRQTWKGK